MPKYSATTRYDINEKESQRKFMKIHNQPGGAEAFINTK
jgi:hypothetical protein